MTINTTVISDLHLGSTLCQVDHIIEFLQSLNTDRLILNGDVFDDHDFRRLNKKHWKVLSLLRKLSNDMEVIWIAGNHDGPMEFISLLLGVKAVEEYELISSGVRFLIHHGDIHDTFITDYPFLTWIADYLYHAAQKINHKFAKLLKRGSKTFMHNVALVKKRAIEMARRRKFNGVICGHSHYAECDDCDGITYANSGSWIELPCSYLTVDQGRAELHFK